MTINLHETDRTLRGVIDGFEDDVAIVLVGEAREPWDFPLAVVPPHASTHSVLILERCGETLRVVDVDVIRPVDRSPVIDAGALRASRHLRRLRQLAGC